MVTLAWKDFLKPDWKKLLVFLILISFVSITFQPSNPDMDEEYFFPFPLTSITKIGSDCIPCGIKAFYDVDYLNLTVNLVFWYLFACTIVALYNMVKK